MTTIAYVIFWGFVSLVFVGVILLFMLNWNYRDYPEEVGEEEQDYDLNQFIKDNWPSGIRRVEDWTKEDDGHSNGG